MKNLVLNITIRIGTPEANDAMQNSSDVANALEETAARFRDAGYVETLQNNPGDQLTRGITDGCGITVGEFTLQPAPT